MGRKDLPVQLGRRDARSSLTKYTIVKCAYQGDEDEDYFPGWIMTEPNEAGCVNVLHFNDKQSRQPDWSCNVPIALVTTVEGATMGPPTEAQLQGIWRDLTKAQKELAKKVPNGDEGGQEARTPENPIATGGELLNDNEAEGLVDSFVDVPEHRDAADEALRQQQDAIDGCDKSEDDETDEFASFTCKELKRVARKLGIAQTGTKQCLIDRIRPAWQLEYPDLSQICDPKTGLPQVKEASKVSQPNFEEEGQGSGGSPLQVGGKPNEVTPKANEGTKEVSLHKLSVIVSPRDFSLFATQFVTCGPLNV